MDNIKDKDILNWIYVHGYNIGLFSQKIFQMLEKIENFQPIDDTSENFKEDLLLDLQYLDKLVSEKD